MIFGMPEEEYFAPGHRACAGCGAATAMRLITKAAGPNTVLVESTGCMEVVSTPYPQTAWRLPWIHGAFENSAAIASGVEAALKAQGRKKDINVVAFAGDGSTFDIGIGPISGMFERNHDVLYVCYDNEAYMNTGIQRSSATPFGASTSTHPAGKESKGKTEWKKDLTHIIAAHGTPYVATASISHPRDLFKKIQKGIEIKGATFVHILAPCPTGWRSDGAKTVEIAKLAVNSGVFPLFEIEDGKHVIQRPKKVTADIREYLKLQGRFKHLDEKDITFIEEQVKKRYDRLVKLAESGL
ncbi:MAG: pyruvate synthase subunit PorB [Candidatus Undinarchaeales archaeon]|nr:pyruvate synthase subunit PorB [Candidatus Undinarchaeales archaeon]MDP7494180.1 pyruvate synthase subunit PorB [Candidatus Undinarchaeales archaeon]